VSLLGGGSADGSGGDAGNCEVIEISGIGVCVPSSVYPSTAMRDCRMNENWQHIASTEEVYARYRTGGLGKLMRADQFEVWICSLQPAPDSSPLSCSIPQGDVMCYTFSEVHHVFVPWGLNSELKLF